MNRHHIGTLVTAAAFLAGSLSLNPIIAGMMGGIGTNLLSSQILEAINAACQGLGSLYMLNSDIRQAWQRAFRRAVEYLEKTYKDSSHFQHSSEQGYIERAFDNLLHAAAHFFTSIHQDQNTQAVLALLLEKQDIQPVLSRYLDDYFCDGDDHVRGFVKQHLVVFLVQFFIEELKANEGAWKEFQLLACKEFQTSLKQLQTDSQEARTLLRELPEQWKQFSREMLDVVAHDLTAKSDPQFATTWAMIHEEASQARVHMSTEADRVIEAITQQDEIPFDEGLLALLNVQKEQCQRRNVAVYTPHLLLTLLSIRDGVAQRAFNTLEPDRAPMLRNQLEQYTFQLPEDPNVKPYPQNFRWEDLRAVQQAWKWAQKDGSKRVTEKHLLRGILAETKESATVQSLKKGLGGEDWRKLMRIVRAISNGSVDTSGTPGIDSFLQRGEL